MAVILDTDAVSAVLAGDAALATLLASEEQHHLPVIVIGEYRYGLSRSRDRDRLSKLLDMLLQESVVLPVDVETTAHYALLREQLRRRGRPIPENDVWVAAIALQHGLPIVSRDLHFDEVPELQRFDW